MTPSVQALFRAFDQLSDADKREFVAEIWRRSPQGDVPPLTDDEPMLTGEALWSWPYYSSKTATSPNLILTRRSDR